MRLEGVSGGVTTYAGGALFRIPDPIGRSLGGFSENYGYY
jgi:hypothetical protein